MIGLLIRHGHVDPIGKWLAGRRPGVSLSADGRRDALRLVRALTWVPVTAVYTSPLERAVETAIPIATDHGICVSVRPALTDLDFGVWTGMMLAQLSDDPEWQSFNRDRGRACPPAGEPLVDAQHRVVNELMTLAKCHAGELVAIVTHAEPIRCVLAAFAGHSLDAAAGVEIDPGHVSSIGVTGGVGCVLGVNVHPNEITV